MNNYRIYLPTRLAFTSVLLVSIILLSACGESIVVPSSDTTSPTIVMNVHFTTTEGQRQTIELKQDSTTVSADLDPTEPIAVLASARDTDGGVMGIKTIVNIAHQCKGNPLITPINATREEV